MSAVEPTGAGAGQRPLPGQDPEAAAGRAGGRLEALRGLAARVLRVPETAVDVRAPLSAVGLDSLSAVELCDAVEAELGVRVEMARLLEGASLAELAAELGVGGEAEVGEGESAATGPEPRLELAAGLMEGGEGAAGPLAAAGLEGDWPLSQGQRALWFLDRLAPGGSAYVLAGAVRVRGNLDVLALGRALRLLARRHPLLTATFHEVGGSPVQRFGAGAEIAVAVEEAAGLNGAGGPGLAARLTAAARRPFDLARGPLLRATVFRAAGAEAVVLVAVHHIVADFASLAILARELGPLYRQETGGPPAGLPPLRASYLDQIARQTAVLAEAGGRLWDFWREELAGAPLVLELPADRPRLAALPDGQGDGRSVAAPWESAAGPALAALARGSGATLYVALLAAFEVLLARTSGQEDLLLGSPMAGRGGADLAGVVGYFVDPLVVRSDVGGDPTFAELLARVRQRVLRLFAHSGLPFPLLAERLAAPGREAGRSPVFQVLLTLQGRSGPERGAAAEDGLAALAVGRPGVALGLLPGLAVETLALPPGAPLFDLVLEVARMGDGSLAGRVTGDAALFDPATVARFASHFGALLDGAVARPAARISELPLCTAAERWQLTAEWNDTAVAVPESTVAGQIAAQAARTPDAPALTADGRTWSCLEVDRAAGRLAARLRGLGVGPEVPVALCSERSAEMVVGLLAVLRSGGAYLPLDPHYPRERLAFMLADADVPVLLTEGRLAAGLPEHRARVVLLDGALEDADPAGDEAGVHPGIHPENLAYVIYTSGSTGRPKGVAVRQRGVVNFFAGMDAAVGCGPGDRLLAVTSISFDISVLELFWTLARGAEVVLAGEGAMAGPAAAGERAAARARLAENGMAFSLFYFASEGGDTPAPAGGRYRLLLEGARFADRHGFAAVWTPERHFHAFGGLYPNPSVTGAAVAAVTERLAVRAGSVVLPLHDPLRVAEEWAVVDNLSHGRAGIAVASGWHADDFVFHPERYAERKAHLEEGLETVRRLWRGEAVRRLGGAGREVEVRVLPRPVQPELPVWITAAGAAETFAQAGRLGANVLTHLLGQSVEEVAEKVRVYRQARAEHGHDPESGVVTLMLHTLIGDSRAAVRAAVREPFTAYLRSSLGLVANLARSLGLGGDVAALPERDREDLLALAFDRYFETSALFGDLAGGLEMVERLAGIGVDEVACLIDFGVDEERVLAGLSHLSSLREAANAGPTAQREEDRSLAALARRHRPTLLQCTPSLLRLLGDAPGGWAPFAGLRGLLLGGEALPSALAAAVQAALPARLVNVYGPTETTVWSAGHAVPVEPEGSPTPVSPIVPIGRPLANTRIHLLDRRGRPVPAGVPGALHIAGDGLARGYLGRPDLTAARFLPDALSPEPGGRCYDTGDLARRRVDGTLEFLGRADQQIKLRGFRIEPGEIEAALAAMPEVAEAAVVVRRGAAGDDRLVAFCTAAPGVAAGALGAGLRARLAERLPEPMVPALVVPLAALPLTPNGKTDRGALARLDLPEAGEAGAGRAPATPTEEIVAGLYAGLLETGPVAASDSFFGLGGHSLLATQLLSRVRDAFQLELPLRTLFESPTVAGLAARIDAARRLEPGRQAPPIVPVPRDGALPLSFMQQRLWFIDQLEPGNPAYNNSAAVRLRGPLDAAALERALGALVERHEALRTTFPGDPADPGRPVVVIHEPGPAFRLEVESVESDAGSPAALEERLLALAREDARRPFDLARGPLLCARLLQVGPDDAVILLAVHHIVSDGWSLGVLVREVGELYRSFLAGGPPALPALPVQYADFAAWQRRWLAGAALEAEVGYWREALAGAPTVLELPADRPRPAVREPHGRTLRFAYPPALADRLRAVSRGQGATLFMTLLAAFAAQLGAVTGRRDLLVGSPVANRGRSELEGLIGFFVNTLVLRADLGGDPPFAQLLGRVREATLGAYAHQDVPVDQVVEALGVARDLSHTPLFQVAFALQNVALPRLDLPGVAAEPLLVDTGTVKFDWDLSLEETPAGLAGRLAYAAALFDPPTAQRAVGHLEAVLAGVAADPGRPLSALSLLSAAERRQLAEWNDPTVVYEPGGLIHELVAGQAERTPDAVAVAFEDRRLTYGALDALSDRAAAELRAASGAGPEGIVGVLMERSLAMVIGLLAVWKAGAAYLPLDPDDPAERLDHMLRDAGATAVVTAPHLAGRLPDAARALPVLVIGDPGRAVPPTLASQAPPAVLPDHPAYVIYTSGSTGAPKGVVVSHRALANRARYAAATDRAEAFLQKTTIGFDVSVMELFGPLLWGGRTVLARPGGQRDSAYLVRLIAEEQVSHASFPPTLLDALLAEGALDDCRALRTVVTGGESVPPSLPERFFARLARPGIELFNRYGPTEATVSITAWRCRPEPAAALGARILPIGRPTAAAEVHLLAADLRPVPIGVAGEICLGGVCLARGYLGRPALTAEKWIPHPFAEEPGARLYRTGDLARFRADGAIEFLGRVDQQVKLRGFRIELDEIAAVLAAHEAVEEAVAAVREDGGAGRQLVAYWVPRAAGGGVPGEPELRAFVQRRLPEYMLPARFVALAALPTTRTGKVDRAALPAPPRPAGGEGEEGPRTPAEEVLAAVWAQVLGAEPAAGDDFFALGGHSLAAVQVMSRVREAFGVELPLRALFEEPTVAGLARRIDAAQRERAGLAAGPPPVRRVSDPAAAQPLSFAQERLWFLDRLEPGNAAYNMPAAFRLDGPLDAAALAASLAEVERRHGSLRTVFRAGEEGPEQVVRPAAPRPLPRVDLTGLPEAAREAELARLAAREAATPFDLAAGPLWRVVLAPLAADSAALLITLHHIVGDGWSIGVLIREVAALYRSFAAGAPSPLPELPVQYTDYAVWQRRWLAAAGPEGGLAYWRRQLEGVPALALPTDRPRPAGQTYAGAQQPFHLGAETSGALARRARQASATPFMALLAGFAALLGSASNQDDFAVGTFVANRTRPEVEGLIGFFVNNLALRTRLDGDPGFDGLLARCREAALGAFAAQDLPFEAVLEGLRIERSFARPPLFQIMLVLQNMPMERLALGDVTFTRLPLAAGRANFDLTLWLSEEADGFAGQLEYNRDLFEPATAARWARHLAVLLGAAAAEPERRLSELPLLGEAELWQVLGEWSPGPPAIGPAGRTVADLFAEQAAARPDAVAVVAPDGRHLSYAGLARIAGGLAGRLAAAGVGPESAVGVALDRSPEMVAAVLAVLAAGGFYVPLDLASPAARRAATLADAGARVLLTERRHALPDDLAEAGGLAQWLLDGPEPGAPASALPLAGRSAAGHLAYAIYTSGSTGRPKGVLVEHRALAHHTRDAAAAFEIGPGDRVLQFAALAFDASAEEIWPCLTAGATLVLRDDEMIRSPRELLARCGELAVTVLDLPTAYWHELTLALEAGEAAVPAAFHLTAAVPAALRLTILGGERARPERWAAWRRAAPGVRLVNTYGPTEATVVATRADLGPQGPASGELPIGRAISGVQAYVVDRAFRPQPAGFPGELCLGGAGLARGYLHRPDLTAECFVPDPFAGPERPGARLYRTGDLARWRPDGLLEFGGRVDQQVKIRGFRVEPGEVEAALAAHPDVAAAAVTAREDLPGGFGLAAYVAPRPGADLSPEEVRAFLAGRLPEHLIPAAFVVLPDLPRGVTGKVDRRTLPAPERGRPDAGFVAPRTPIESLLAGIWADLLGLERVGAWDSFFQLGGHSLLATRLVSRIHLAFEVDLPLRTLFEAPTLAEMALAVEELVIARLEDLSDDELAGLA